MIQGRICVTADGVADGKDDLCDEAILREVRKVNPGTRALSRRANVSPCGSLRPRSHTGLEKLPGGQKFRHVTMQVTSRARRLASHARCLPRCRCAHQPRTLRSGVWVAAVRSRFHSLSAQARGGDAAVLFSSSWLSHQEVLDGSVPAISPSPTCSMALDPRNSHWCGHGWTLPGRGHVCASAPALEQNAVRREYFSAALACTRRTFMTTTSLSSNLPFDSRKLPAFAAQYTCLQATVCLSFSPIFSS